jgi:hypothetical protein
MGFSRNCFAFSVLESPVCAMNLGHSKECWYGLQRRHKPVVFYLKTWRRRVGGDIERTPE